MEDSQYSFAVIVVFLVGMGGNFNTLGMYTDMNWKQD